MRIEELRKYYVRSYEELYNLLNNRLKSIPASKPNPPLKSILQTKLRIAYNVVVDEVENIIRVLKYITTLHNFYKEMFKLEAGKYPNELIPIFRAMKHQADIVYRECHELLKSAGDRETIVERFRQCLGRTLSIYKRKRRVVQSIKAALSELSKLPDVSGEYIIVIAGMPQAGKSTLLAKLTRAKPKISPFPFTTKTVIVGHIDVEPYGKIVLIDTPGLLDRPIDVKNPIEIKAVLAIKYLADLALYLFDISPHSYYTLEEQINVFESVRNLLVNREVMALINKIDVTPPDILSEVINFLKDQYGVEPLLISALRGDNIDHLKKIIIERFMEKIQCHK